MKDESTTETYLEKMQALDEVAPINLSPVTDSVEFWLGFPIELRPLKFIPGRNRKEKRAFQKLASQAERGTISKGHPKGGGGNLKRLRGMLQLFQSLGIAKMAPASEGEKK